jgi:hypothetical protein
LKLTPLGEIVLKGSWLAMKWCMALVCSCFGVFILLAGDAVQANGSFHSTTGETHTAAPDTLKKKTKKTEEEPVKKKMKKWKKTNIKPEKSQSKRVSEEEPDFWEECAVECLSDLLASICSGIVGSSTGGDEEGPATEMELEEPVIIGDTTNEAPSEFDHSLGGTDSTGTLPYIATIMPVSEGENAVLLWDKPGGEEMLATVLDTLEVGTEVSVIRIFRIENIFWVKVETEQEPRISGWIRERETSPIEVPDIHK